MANNTVSDAIHRSIEIANRTARATSERNTSTVNDVSMYSVSGRGFHASQTYRYGEHVNYIGVRRASPSNQAVVGVGGNTVGY